MATLGIQTVALAGTNATYANAAAGGDKVACGDRTFLHVKNGSASPVTVTLTSTGAIRGQTVSNVTVSVPASGDRFIGPIARELFAGASDGLCAVGYSATTTVTVAALQI
jgi:hypothetical protein